MLWEHLQNKDFYLFSGAPTSAKLLPLASVQKELSVSWRSFQPEPVPLESGVIPEGLQGAEKNCCSNCWAATWRRQRCHVLASTSSLFQLQLKLRLFLRKGRWLVEYYHTLNQLERTELGGFQDGYHGIAFSDLENTAELDGDWQTNRQLDGRIDECGLWVEELATTDKTRWAWEQQPRENCIMSCPPLDVSASKEEPKPVNTARNTQIHMFTPVSTFFCLTTLLTFFFLARYNAEVITAP